MLNGPFKLNGEDYWRVDDMDRMQAESSAGTYDVLAQIKRFGVAINQHNCDHAMARKLVDAMNKVAGEAS